MSNAGSTPSGNGVVQIVQAPQPPRQTGRLMALPTELRHKIFELMLILTRGPQSFLCLPNGYAFVTGLDLSFPLITRVCRDMFLYVVGDAEFRKICLAYRVLACPPQYMTLQIPYFPNPRSWPIFGVVNPFHRVTGWFSATHDTFELEYDDHPEWVVTDVWTVGAGGPYVGHVTELARSTPKIDAARQNAQQGSEQD
ncbi:hypothetical protein PG994_001097 [Apiospora phragmitis]|uniref:Uncharacterized protein n=1 Tax=Apiospora phragmitis TaxID=2905665 RepID=A0ABR1WSJ0_9PEZI